MVRVNDNRVAADEMADPDVIGLRVEEIEPMQEEHERLRFRGLPGLRRRGLEEPAGYWLSRAVGL